MVESIESPPTPPAPPARGRSRALVVAGGILASRLFGFVRERAAAHYFGVGAHADVLQAAFRGPNLLQNLLGEGTVSAAFIPVYSRMLAEGRERDAGRFAGAVFGLLAALAAALTLAGMALAPPLVALLAPGFVGDAARVAAGALPVDRFALTVAAVRWIFPMTGVLVLSAWALGVLNSHRRFFLPYFAPVLWNTAILAALVWAGQGGARADLDRLVLAACAGGFAGGLLQFAVQLPLVARELSGFRLSLSTTVPGVRQALAAFGPVVAGRGVVQISAYLDVVFASWLAAGALGALRYAQMLYVLPVSLFGLSVAAAELPELARLRPDEVATFADRLRRSLAQALFLVLPTTAGYLAFGLLLVGGIYRTGSFGLGDEWLVYLVLAAYSLGLPAATAARQLQNAFYALSETRVPARVAALRVAVSAAIALPAMLALDRIGVERVAGQGLGTGLYLGAVGLGLGSTVAAWLELALLARSVHRRLPAIELPWGRAGRIAALAAAAALPAGGLVLVLPDWHVAARAALVVLGYGAAYLGGAAALRMPELGGWTAGLERSLRRRKKPGEAG